MIAIFIIGMVLMGGVQSQEDLLDAIPGIPGEDYPALSQTVETSFSCDEKIPGYYADLEGDCQQYHICGSDGNFGLIKYTFLCPNGTMFNQQYFICDWWFNIDCSTAEDFYYLNAEVAEAAATANDRRGRADLGLGSGSSTKGLSASGLSPLSGLSQSSRDPPNRRPVNVRRVARPSSS